MRVNEPGCPIWHELISPDLPAATAFYTDVLGVEWEAMPMETGDDYTCLMVAGRPVGGAMPPQMEGIPPHWNVYFNVEDVRRHGRPGRRARRRSVLAPAYDVPGVGRMAMLRDPQGALFSADAEPARVSPPSSVVLAERVGGVDAEDLHVGGEERAAPRARAPRPTSEGWPSTSARNWVAVNSPPTM